MISTDTLLVKSNYDSCNVCVNIQHFAELPTYKATKIDYPNQLFGDKTIINNAVTEYKRENYIDNNLLDHSIDGIILLALFSVM